MARHPGNPAKMPAGHVQAATIRDFERKCAAGLICWYCTSDAVATLVQPSLESVYRDGVWNREMVHVPVCGPGWCRFQERRKEEP